MSDRLRVLYLSDGGRSRDQRADAIETVHGFEVVTATDAADARSRLEAVHVDCALVDLDAEDVETTFVASVRETHPEVPVVALVDDGDRVAAALDAGAADYFSTAEFDVTAPPLAHRVRRAAGQHRGSERTGSDLAPRATSGDRRAASGGDTSARAPPTASGAHGDASADRGSAAGEVRSTADAGDDLVAIVRDAFRDDRREAGQRTSGATADSSDEAREPGPNDAADRTGGDATAAESGFEFGGPIHPPDRESPSGESDAGADAGGRSPAGVETPEPGPSEGGDGRTSPQSGTAGRDSGRRADTSDSAGPSRDAVDSEAPALPSSGRTSRSDRSAAPDPGAVEGGISTPDATADAGAETTDDHRDSPPGTAGSIADPDAATTGEGSSTEPDGDATAPSRSDEPARSAPEHVPDDLSPQEGVSVLVQGAPRSERAREVCADLLGLDDGDRNVLLVGYEPIDDARLERIAGDADRVTVVAVGYAPSVPAAVRDHVETVEVTPPSEVTRLGIVITSVLRDWESLDAWTVVCYDSLNSLLRYKEADEAFRFLHLLLNQLHASGATSHFHADLQAGNPREIGTLKPLFDETARVDHD